MHTERGFDRLVNFSDAVVAIAITLLILPLVDSAADLGDLTFGELIEKDGSKLLVFAISFAVIGRFWLAHHRIYESVIGYNTELLWVNLLWLLSIVFLPFPTELISTAGSSNHVTVAIYVGTMLVTTLAGLWQQWVLIRHPELQAPEVRGTLTLTASVIATVMMAGVLVLALVFPSLGLFALLFLLLTGPIQAVVKRRGRVRSAAAAGSGGSGSGGSGSGSDAGTPRPPL